MIAGMLGFILLMTAVYTLFSPKPAECIQYVAEPKTDIVFDDPHIKIIKASKIKKILAPHKFQRSKIEVKEFSVKSSSSNMDYTYHFSPKSKDHFYTGIGSKIDSFKVSLPGLTKLGYFSADAHLVLGHEVDDGKSHKKKIQVELGQTVMKSNLRSAPPQSAAVRYQIGF